MLPSDFPRGPDGVRFRVVHWRTGTSGPWTASVIGSDGNVPTPEQIASALNQVAEWEEKQTKQQKLSDEFGKITEDDLKRTSGERT